MKLGLIPAGTLLAYSTVLENIIQSNLEIQREMNNAVSEGYCSKEEVDDIYSKSVSALQEADERYQEIQKELDLKMKSDLGTKYGIRRSQSIIKEFDAFVRMKNNDHESKRVEEASEEKVHQMEIVENDTAESE